jgi:hypothetical protein
MNVPVAGATTECGADGPSLRLAEVTVNVSQISGFWVIQYTFRPTVTDCFSSQMKPRLLNLFHELLHAVQLFT